MRLWWNDLFGGRANREPTDSFEYSCGQIKPGLLELSMRGRATMHCLGDFCKSAASVIANHMGLLARTGVRSSGRAYGVVEN